MSKNIIIGTDATFDEIIATSKVPVLVDFWAAWCGPCRALTPALEELAADLGDKVKIVKVNVDEQTMIAGKLGIRSIPTVIAYNNGQLQETTVGLHAKEFYKDLVNKFIS